MILSHVKAPAQVGVFTWYRSLLTVTVLLLYTDAMEYIAHGQHTKSNSAEEGLIAILSLLVLLSLTVAILAVVYASRVHRGVAPGSTAVKAASKTAKKKK